MLAEQKINIIFNELKAEQLPLDGFMLKQLARQVVRFKKFDEFKRWMKTKNPILRNTSPKNLISLELEKKLVQFIKE